MYIHLFIGFLFVISKVYLNSKTCTVQFSFVIRFDARTKNECYTKKKKKAAPDRR